MLLENPPESVQISEPRSPLKSVIAAILVKPWIRNLPKNQRNTKTVRSPVADAETLPLPIKTIDKNKPTTTEIEMVEIQSTY